LPRRWLRRRLLLPLPLLRQKPLRLLPLLKRLPLPRLNGSKDLSLLAYSHIVLLSIVGGQDFFWYARHEQCLTGASPE